MNGAPAAVLRPFPPPPRLPPLPLGPALDRRGLPQRPDTVDLLRIRELPLGVHLRHPKMRDPEISGNVTDPEHVPMVGAIHGSIYGRT